MPEPGIPSGFWLFSVLPAGLLPDINDASCFVIFSMPPAMFFAMICAVFVLIKPGLLFFSAMPSLAFSGLTCCVFFTLFAASVSAVFVVL